MITTDLDGTLLNDQRQVSARDRATLEAAGAAGIGGAGAAGAAGTGAGGVAGGAGGCMSISSYIFFSFPNVELWV